MVYINTSLFRTRALRFGARQPKLHIRARVRQAIGPTSIIKPYVRYRNFDFESMKLQGLNRKHTHFIAS